MFFILSHEERIFPGLDLIKFSKGRREMMGAF